MKNQIKKVLEILKMRNQKTLKVGRALVILNKMKILTKKWKIVLEVLRSPLPLLMRFKHRSKLLQVRQVQNYNKILNLIRLMVITSQIKTALENSMINLNKLNLKKTRIQILMKILVTLRTSLHLPLTINKKKSTTQLNK